MNRRRGIVLGVWALLIVSYTFASGFAVPPRTGSADPDATGPDSSAQLERLVAASTEGADRFSLTPATSVHGPTELTVLVAPERSPYPTEGEVLDRFMADGGTLLVFAANDAWNEFLLTHGIRLDGSTLLATGNATQPHLLDLDLPQELGGGQMTLPNATAVRASGEDVATYQPDQETVIDVNGNGTIEPGVDQAGAFPVAAATDVGKGRLVVLASSAAVLGPGLERNLDATGDLLTELGAEERSALDAGTHPRGWKDLARAPASATLSVAQAHPAGLGVIGLLAAGLVLALPGKGEEGETGGLDEYTEVTREVVLDGGD